jgi:S-(hydroxymethyl)glutathione dehydrogenase/alcohol dehydrogenase
MKAAVMYESNKPLQVEEVTLDEPQDQEVLVKMVATGLCHTDVHFIHGEAPVPVPVVLGHEGAGIVEKVGPGVTTVQPGDHVVLMVAWSCGKCRFCVEGQPGMCTEWVMYNMMGTLPGGAKRLHKGDQELNHFFCQSSFAEYAVVHERTAIKVPQDAPLDVVCLLGCGTTTGIGSVLNRAKLKSGESIVIYGCGGVGLSAVLGARLAGAGKIIAVDMLDRKLEKAKELGADFVINATQEDPPQRVMEITGGGADYSVECIGNVDVMAQAFASIHNAGTCVVAGMAPIDKVIPIASFELLMGKTLTGTLQGNIRPPVDVPKYVDLYMGGKLPIDKLITRSYSLDSINEAVLALEKGEVIRSVIRFQ